MKLFGVSADHEPITGEEVFSRLEKGYHVSLRYSSIRPDLPHILTDLARLGLTHFDDLSFTTDASTPSFIEKGLINICIEEAIIHGVRSEEHTSELQSRGHLVCRLLLEKKKNERKV